MRRLAAAVLLGCALAGAARAEQACAVPPALALRDLALPAAHAAVRADHRLVVLAVGSAPTLGAAADGAAFAYPSRLEAHLAALLPGIAVTVLNKGAAHRSTHSMARHLPAQLAESGARLVLWETGGREASRAMDLDSYASELQHGLEEIRAAGADTILLDLQYTPGMMRLAPVDPYRQVIHDAAANAGIAVFQRYELMTDWAKHGLNLAAADSAARVPLARRLYDCIALALARAIAPAVR
jgi:hypothetical protein